MRSLPLFPSLPVAPIETEQGLDTNHQCTRCPLSTPLAAKKLATVCMSPEGEPGGLLVIGEFPSKDDDRQGRPFLGVAGTVVRQAIEKHWSGPVALTLALGCAPGHDVDKSKLEKPVEACRGYLAQTMRDVQPQRIITIGSWAAFSVLGRSISMMNLRKSYSYLYTTTIDKVGAPLARLGGHAAVQGYVAAGEGVATPVPVFPVLQPTMALRNRFLKQWLDEDLAWALTCENPPEPPVEGIAYVVENEQDARAAIAQLIVHRRVSFDIEAAGVMYDPSYRVLCIALTPVENAGRQSIAWVWGKQALADDGARAVLAAYLGDPRYEKTATSGKYDCQGMRLLGAVVQGLVSDARLARKLIEPEASGKLEDMAELVGMGGHKEDAEEAISVANAPIRSAMSAEKRCARYDAWLTAGSVGDAPPKPSKATRAQLGYMGELALREPVLIDVIRGTQDEPKRYVYALIDETTLHVYCARDAVSTARLDLWLEPQVESEPAFKFIWHDVVMPAARAIEHLERWGTPVSRPAIEKFDAYLAMKMIPIRDKLDQYGGTDFDPNSTAQVRDLLFKKLGLKPVGYTATELESTDKDTLGELADEHPACAAIVEWRRLAKLRATYAGGMLDTIRADGRVHPSILLDGTRTGRMSSQGPNLFNAPRAKGSEEALMFRQCFIAEPGKVFLEVDFSQAELRKAAELSGDKEMIKMYVDGVDFHMQTARLVSRTAWGVGPDEVTEEMRARAKTIVFSLIYGSGDKALAEKVNVSLEAAKKIRHQVLGKFTGLARWIEQQIVFAKRHGYIWTQWQGQNARRRPLIQIADPDDFKRMVAEHGSFNCLDAETEALTPRGWVRGFDLSRDDILLTKNPITGALEWEGMTDLKLWPDYSGPLVEFKSRSFHAVTTPDHRWLVRTKNGEAAVERTTRNLSPRGDDRIHRTGDYRPALKSGLTPDEAELLGWFVTDGVLHGPKRPGQKTFRGRTYKTPRATVQICQSSTANPAKCARIDTLLKRLNACSGKYTCSSNGITYWSVSERCANLLTTRCPSRTLTVPALLDLDRTALDRLREAMLLGDGHREAGDDGTLCTGRREQAEAFQVLCTLTGAAASIVWRDMSKYKPASRKMKNVPKMTGIWLVTVLRRDTAQVLARQRTEFQARQPVWCPIVPNTFFVARRSGHVYVTGNTPVQSGATEHNNAAMSDVVMWILSEGIESDVKLMLPIYDSLLLEVKESMVAEVAWQVRTTMLSRAPTTVPFDADAKIGRTWGDMKTYAVAP